MIDQQKEVKALFAILEVARDLYNKAQFPANISARAKRSVECHGYVVVDRSYYRWLGKVLQDYTDLTLEDLKRREARKAEEEG